MKDIAKKIEKAGGRLYLVGGAVRDTLLGIKVHDEDYCVTGLTDEEFVKLFPESFYRGKSFGVFDLNGKEFALARTETKTGIGHKAFKTNTNKNVKIEEDLARRDITINAMAQDVLTGEIIDPFEGKKDLENKIIRATTEKFKEDPLRVYRVARFSAKFEFQVEENTIRLMNSLKEEMKTLSKERIFEEFRKALETSKPSLFFETLKQAEVLEIHFKEVYNLIGSTQPTKYHPEGDSYNHTMLALDYSTELTKDAKIRYSVLVHDLGKGTTPKEMLPHHYNHDDRGVEPVKNLSNRIGVPVLWKKSGQISAKYHMKAGMFEELRTFKQIDLIEMLQKSVLGLDGMKIVTLCDRESTGSIRKVVDFDKIGKEILSKINGKYIEEKYGQLEGEEFGKRLRQERIKYLKNIEIK